MKYKIRINRKKYEIYDGFGHKWQIGKDPEIMAPRVFIERMNEPTLTMTNDFQCTFTFDPVPPKVAEEMIRENKIRFQVVRHKTSSRHTRAGEVFPYEFRFPKYKDSSGRPNTYWGISLPNNQGSRNYPERHYVSTPTYTELISGTLTRDMSDLQYFLSSSGYDNYCKWSTHWEDKWSQWTQEFYLGFIYWDSFSEIPTLYKMAYWSTID